MWTGATVIHSDAVGFTRLVGAYLSLTPTVTFYPSRLPTGAVIAMVFYTQGRAVVETHFAVLSNWPTGC